MRCPDCSKFVPYNTEEEPEPNGEEFDGSEFSAEITRTLTCENCGTELKSTVFDISVTAEIEMPEAASLTDEKKKKSAKEKKEEDEHEHEWEVEVTCSPTSRTITVDRNGKKITKARYMTTEYGVEVEFDAKCDCGATAHATAEDYIAASSMDELT